MMIVTTGDDVGGRWRTGYAFLAIVSALVLAIDFGAKSWVRHSVGGFLESAALGPNVTIALKPNPGGAWGLMSGAKQTVNRVVFSLVSLIAILVVIWLYRRLRPLRTGIKWGLPLVLGGAIGNLLDRLRFGHVIDFIDLHLVIRGVQRHAPYFNLADVAITIGVGLMAIEVLRRRPGVITVLLTLCACESGPPFVGHVERSQFWEYHDQTEERLCPSLLSLLDEHAQIVGNRIGLDLDPSRPFRYYKFSDQQAFDSSHESGGKAFGDYLYSPHYFEAHEQAHVYTFRAWGGWSIAFLNEGEAVALSCNPTKEPDANTTPGELHGPIDWRTQIDHFSFAPQEYATAGLFVTHLAQQYGWERVAELHRGVPPGTAPVDFERAFARVFPVSVDEAWSRALDTRGAPACDKTWTCRATPLATGEPAQPECDGQLHRSLMIADGNEGIVLDIADGRGVTLSGRCADRGARWYPLAGTTDDTPATHWAFVPPGPYTLFAGASDAYVPPGKPASITDGEFPPTDPAPSSYELRSSIPAGTIADACRPAASLSLNSEAVTYVDLFRGFVDSWIAIDGGNRSFSVGTRNLSAPFSVSSPADICDGCGPDATCTAVPVDSLTIGGGAFLHLRDLFVDRLPAAGQFVFRPTTSAHTDR